MRRTLVIGLAACIIALAGFSPRWLTRASAQQDLGSAQLEPQNLDAKAARAQAGDGPSVRELGQGVVEKFGWTNLAAIRGRVLDRTVRAELAYRAGQHPAIPEENVVGAVNNLAQALAAPDYAKTSLAQVRYLRMSLAMSAPHLVGGGDRDANENEIPRSMSPMEATYLTLSLVHQKLFNPRFQEPREGWLERRQRESLERLGVRPHEGVEDGRSVPRLLSVINPRAAEMRKAISEAFTAQLAGVSADAVLDDLGVSR